MTARRTPYAHLDRKPKELRAVDRAAERYQASRFALRDAIRDAHAAGHSLRAIAEASGVYSHEQVRQIVSAG
jgi:hypothetical protein